MGQRRLEIIERPVPKPSFGEVLLAVVQVGICGTDQMIFQGGLAQRVAPGRILGHEMFAVVAEASADGLLKTGDRVVVEPTVSCGHCGACRRGLRHVCERLRILGIDADGAFRQFWAVPSNQLHKLPDAINADNATLIEPLSVAVHAIRLAALNRGDHAVVIGGGPIGLLIAMLARRAGADTLVLEIDPFRQAFARQLGFSICDPSGCDAIETVRSLTNESGAEVVFEASGSAAGARLMTSLAAVRGRLMVVGIQAADVSVNLYAVFQRELVARGVRAYSTEDFREAIRLLADREIQLEPFITRRFPLRDIQAAMEAARPDASVMKIVIDVGTA